MDKDRLPKSLYSPTYARFLVELRNARTAAGLTQVEAAERLRRPQSFISKCESGERRVDVAEFLVLCRAYGIDPCQVLGAIEERPPKLEGTSKRKKQP